MKIKVLSIVYSLFTLLFLSCRSEVDTQEKTRKIAVRTFTGMGENNDITTWFYIKNIAVGGYSGYYFKDTSGLNDFKDARFTYSTIRPVEFEGQYASGEKINFLEPGGLPDDLLRHLADLESVYK